MKPGYAALNDLNQFFDGAINSRLERELSNVSANIADINTDPKKARKITIQIILKPNEDRSGCSVSASIITKLEQPMPITVYGNVGRDENNRMTIAKRTGQNPGQLNLYGEELKPTILHIDSAEKGA